MILEIAGLVTATAACPSRPPAGCRWRISTPPSRRSSCSRGPAASAVRREGGAARRPRAPRAPGAAGRPAARRHGKAARRVCSSDRGRAMLVQGGLPGIPWFRLGDRYTTPATGWSCGAAPSAAPSPFTTPWPGSPTGWLRRLPTTGSRSSWRPAWRRCWPRSPRASPAGARGRRCTLVRPARSPGCPARRLRAEQPARRRRAAGHRRPRRFRQVACAVDRRLRPGTLGALHASRRVAWHHRAEDLAACQRPPARRGLSRRGRRSRNISIFCSRPSATP